jgi:hypothetical protein
MDPTAAARHATLKKFHDAAATTPTSLHAMIEESARHAFALPWHRLARGLRLNRLRIYVAEIAPTHGATEEEKTTMFNFLQRALDRKVLNTSKIVLYDIQNEKITSIKGLEIKRGADGTLKLALSAPAKRGESTRKKKKDADAATAAASTSSA